MASPALHPIRPSGWIDPRRPAEYPIVLGDSLKESGTGSPKKSLLNIRYNWQPKSGFGSRESKLTKSGDEYQLLIASGGSEDDGDFRYTGVMNLSEDGKPEDRSRPLALVFDKAKSCFMLETLSASLDMNLKQGAGHSSKEAHELPQLPTRQPQSTKSVQTNASRHTSPAPEDETPDASNPYDYRHFLAEARENMEKSAQQPGNRTPLSGLSTPVPSGSRFSATTPQFKPTPVTSHPTTQRKKRSDGPTHGPGRTTTPSTSSKAATKRDNPKTSAQPLSKTHITDSDSDDDETLAVSRPGANPRSNTSGYGSNQRPSQRVTQSHTRNISANIGSSPHIIINDDDGGLEIDMGSPPPDDRPSRRGRVDPEMFRSHTGTPVGGISSNAQSQPLPSFRPGADEQVRHNDREVTMKDIEGASIGSSDEDGDVEEFELGSPQDRRLTAPASGDISRADDEDEDEAAQSRHLDKNVHRHHHHNMEEPPTPPALTTRTGHDDDDDDEDLLAAALEAALEEEEEESKPAMAPAAGIGLGIGIGMAPQDDESEVSEEE
ncbi:hypothetical protein A1O1_04833 [Capronia coronata CBS 617.96]|uniref:Transcription elongation factor Eaf N-terminal domain-containing protein n=1 Tax=Capronia coronata CBS 617.96 TaxID=1182541 RepID=W9YF93_9EURO|nr:uncharacterized protein A1O1_04833 [Capronia coronata CBS 617.96]EXJ87906.1 hypothetical protein A1O1_04833 [Capronia coronata CBS 617.96]